ncbi:hypothetical protein J6590_055744 [Homalodisca vitripennis]|nr:hypothetical protein J6590_055744 [Homalodisca vitripennis]
MAKTHKQKELHETLFLDRLIQSIIAKARPLPLAPLPPSLLKSPPTSLLYDSLVIGKVCRDQSTPAYRLIVLSPLANVRASISNGTDISPDNTVPGKNGMRAAKLLVFIKI